MHILQLDTSFLEKDVESWPGCAAFLALNVINDCAERGVKLSSDFLASARIEQHLQNYCKLLNRTDNVSRTFTNESISDWNNVYSVYCKKNNKTDIQDGHLWSCILVVTFSA